MKHATFKIFGREAGIEILIYPQQNIIFPNEGFYYRETLLQPGFSNLSLFTDRPSWTLRQRCWRTLQHCRRSRRIAPTPHIRALARPIPRNRPSSSPRPRTRKQRMTRSRLDRHPGIHYRPGSPTSGYDRPIS